MMGGNAIICPECSYHWTLNPAVPVSWSCPQCGGAKTEETEQYVCKCGHKYIRHQPIQKVRPSRDGFWIRGNQAKDNIDAIVAALQAEPEPTPDVGKCSQCTCGEYHLQPFGMSAEDYLWRVGAAVTHGSGGREISSLRLDQYAYAFTSGRRNVLLRNEGGDLIRLYRGKAAPASGKKPLEAFVCGQATIAEMVIAIRGALAASDAKTPSVKQNL